MKGALFVVIAKICTRADGSLKVVTLVKVVEQQSRPLLPFHKDEFQRPLTTTPPERILSTGRYSLHPFLPLPSTSVEHL